MRKAQAKTNSIKDGKTLKYMIKQDDVFRSNAAMSRATNVWLSIESHVASGTVSPVREGSSIMSKMTQIKNGSHPIKAPIVLLQ